MPDLPSRTQREKELAAALLLVLGAGLSSGSVSAAALASAAHEPLQHTYAEAVRNMLKATSADGSPPLSGQDLDARADRWAKEYAAALGREIADSTRYMVDRAVDVGAVFGPTRAEMIAATEITRTISVAEAWLLLFWSEQGFEAGKRVWRTERDGRVCPVCRPLDGQPEPVWRNTAPAGPPAHPNCRCWLDYQVS